jgi:hypothetical protein
MFVEDDKLPEDVVRKAYAANRHALCCLDCGFESSFDPLRPGSIGPPLLALLKHDCPNNGD